MKLRILNETPTSITFEVTERFFWAIAKERAHRLVLQAARRRKEARS